MTEAPAPEPEAPGRPTWWQRAILRGRRWHLTRLTVVGLAALLLGLGLGRWSAPDVPPDARRALERAVEPSALEADTLWTSSSADDRPPISEAVPLVERGERLDAVQTWTVEWLSEYDDLLWELTVPDLPAVGRPVQRQYVSAVTLSRDAVDVLRHATRTEDPAVRRALVAEVLRLRQRGEHLAQGARASLHDLQGGEGDVSQHPRLPDVGEVVEGG